MAKPFRGDTYRELGGLFGGHVAIQIYDRVYGFYYADRNNIHIFPNNKNKNSLFQNQSLQEWEDIVRHKKETIISIPATEDEKELMLHYYLRNIERPEWDYSFWEERCASNCFRLLSKFNKVSAGSRFFKAFFPGQLLYTLKREAKERDYFVRTKPGDPRRIWA